MGKILWGVFCVTIVFGTIFVSAKKDTIRGIAYDNCLKQFNSEHIPFEGREGYLMACMD